MMGNSLIPSRSDPGLSGGADPFLSLHRELNRVFDDVLHGRMPSLGHQGEAGTFMRANMNVSETENEIRITADLPGVSEQDIDVRLEDDVLSIRGEKKLEHSSDKENFHFMERSYGTFQRSLRLPFTVNPDEIRAEFQNGVLTVTLPKAALQERSRRIQVKGGSGGNGGSGSSGGSEVKAGSADKNTKPKGSSDS